MSSIIHAILFYSKSNKKSVELYKVIKSLNIGMELISVDSEKVREMLLNDDRFGIDRVPSILLIYDNGHFKTFIGESLDNWVQELVENVTNQQQPQQAQQTQMFNQDSFTSIDDDTNLFDEQSFQEQDFEPKANIKPLNGSKTYREIKGNLPPPGRIKMTGAELGGINTIIPIEGDKPHVSKEVKKEGPSPSEIAKQLAEQREAMEEEYETQRPTIF